jgi:hypothetical protein
MVYQRGDYGELHIVLKMELALQKVPLKKTISFAAVD